MKSKSLEKRKAKLDDKNKLMQWGLDIRNRDGNKCVICGSTERLNAHHIIPRENKRFRFDLNNGILLCVRHHKFSLEISPHRNSFMFYLWLQQNRAEQFVYLSEKAKLLKSDKLNLI